MNIYTKATAIAVVLAVTATAASCGSSSKSKRRQSSTGAAQPTTSTAPGPSATTGALHATLTGANHSPVANKNWKYTVRVADAGGRPLSGTADIEFTFSGQVVGRATPPVEPIKNGRWSDTLQFPTAAVGHPIALQVVVHTKDGSVTLSWPVNVSP